jgi:hypothetical protein
MLVFGRSGLAAGADVLLEREAGGSAVGLDSRWFCHLLDNKWAFCARGGSLLERGE